MSAINTMMLEGQMSIFDLLDTSEYTNESQFSWDADINEINKRLHKVADTHGITISSEDWTVWEHVPHLGYRMAVTMKLKREDLTEAFFDAINDVVDFASDKEIEISPIPPHFFADLEYSSMYIYSMFKDRARQKVKKDPRNRKEH